MTIHRADHPIYLPALQNQYLEYVGDPNERDTANVANSMLNFLEPNPVLYYPQALYSAGHLGNKYTSPLPPIFKDRDWDKTMLIGDSGGYQIGKGVMQNPTTDAEREAIYAWLHAHTDIAMTIDVPAWMPGMDFDEALRLTTEHLDYLHSSSHAGHKWLTVLQGQGAGTANEWFEAMCHYPSYGWAFAGKHKETPYTVLERILTMVDRGLINEERPWLHFLGKATLLFAAFLTVLQKCLREKVSPKIQITYDTSSPFLSASKYEDCYEKYTISPTTMGISGSKLVAKAATLNSTAPLPSQLSAISKLVDMGDLIVPPGNFDKFGWSVVGNHNLDVTLQAHAATIAETMDDYKNNGSALPARFRDGQELIEELFDVAPDMALDMLLDMPLVKQMANLFQQTKTREEIGYLKLENVDLWDELR